MSSPSEKTTPRNDEADTDNDKSAHDGEADEATWRKRAEDMKKESMCVGALINELLRVRRAFGDDPAVAMFDDCTGTYVPISYVLNDYGMIVLMTSR